MVRKIGVGSLSLPMVLLAILWGCNIPWLDGACPGDIVLTALNIPTWSKGETGIHYTVFYSLILLIPAFILGAKCKGDMFASIGKWLSAIITVHMLAALLFMAV